ncbi:protein of unknown function [Shimia gijangensis]|uniref:YjiS-like domain-containing protein n=1 Tax=Shimia gijangensis TaxID=1470563 RepID=A0A1M6FZ59_9RHOB|nr:DUF1127 domain-containing protein [Shimia gijangensis]SHJ02927.1 protein of unknown function [Shimia gijangensis]
MTLIATLGRQAGLSSAKTISLRDMAALRRQRKALTRLDDIALHDLGLTRTQAELEAKRSLWDVPANWRG